ncbi:MAG: fibronectin type III domain-containing protein [Chitinophagaceae bacterium]
MKKPFLFTESKCFKYVVALTLFLFSFTINIDAQILTFEFNAGGSLTSNTNSANITSSTISYTTGTLTQTAVPPNGFTVSNWVNGAAIDLTEYFQFTITPVTNGSFSITTMVVNYSRATNGPQTIAIRSSINNYASDLATATVTNNGTTAQVLTFNVNQATSSTAVTYRLYGYLGAGNNTGSGGFSGTGNDIVVNGTATSSNFTGSAAISRPGRSSICLGDSSSIGFTITGGTPPFTIQTIDDLGLLRTFTGVRNNTPIYVYPQESKTYSISTLTDSNGQSLLPANFSGSASITVTNSPVVSTVGSFNRTLLHNDGLTLTYADGSLCRSFARIKDALGGTSPGSTNVSAQVYSIKALSNSTARHFVSRRVNINPTNNIGSSVTLFFTQSELDSFNSTVTYQQKLPQSSSDTSGVLQKMLVRRTSSSTETSSLLNTFTPDSVRWNATNSQWEVSFTVADNQLSGDFYVSPPFTSSHLVSNLTHIASTPAVGATGASVTVDWDSIPGVTQYRFRIRPQGGNWNTSTITGSQRTVSLAFNTTYEVQVRAYINSTTQGEYTTVYTFTTPLEGGKLQDCLTPTTSVTVNSPSSATVSWSSATNGASYVVQVRPKNSLVWGGSSTSGNSITFNALSSNTIYEYRIRTTCTPGTTVNGTSNFSAVDSFTTLTLGSCGTVNNISVTNVGINSATIRWSPTLYASSYQVQMRLKNSASWGGTTLTDTSFTFNNLSANSQYEFRVRAFCNNPSLTNTPSGLFSSIGEFTTNAQTLTACLPPTNIQTTPTANSVGITWNTALNGMQYFVNLKTQNAGSWGGTTVSTNNITFSSLSPSTNYQVRIRTVCTPGTTFSANSVFSDTVLFVTTSLANLFETGIEASAVRVYPNPAQHLLHIDYSSLNTEPVHVALHDMAGRLIYENKMTPLVGDNNIEIDLSSVSSGLYMLSVIQQGKRLFMNKVQKSN